ncbi:M28 family peptidase [Jiulongibacter sediminis]|uniref:M28 family peptidase n=1 Tax=Jiulongibacter sediminis TaxID=1605367 RepID=UPI0026EC430C|nr:M28 family peptidase [Jiulongibacter sediminis]
MTNFLSIFGFLSLILLSSFQNFGGKTESTFKAINKNVDRKSNAFENLKLATQQIGHRLTGSENGKKAEDFIANTLKSYGYSNTDFQPFEVNSWSRGKLDLVIVPDNSDNFREVDAVSLGHSPKAVHVRAKIVDCGDGLYEDFEKVAVDLNGKVAMFNVDVRSSKNQGKKNLHRSEKTALAIKHGAVAVILINKVKGDVLLTGTASVTGELIDIPAICISYDSGRNIRHWIYDEKNITADIDMLNFFRSVKARNVRAIYNDKAKNASEKIVIGAHLDSWDLAQGAVDNGLGAFSILDIARVFSELKLKTKRPIEFVFFMGEEQGLLGSKAYVNHAIEHNELQNIGLMINLDMLNNCSGFNAFGNDELKTMIDETGDIISEMFGEYGNNNSNHAGLHSDHEYFMLAGVPVCVPSGQLTEDALNCYHADCDSFDLINKSEIENNVKYVSMMLYALANAKSLPKHKNAEETRDYLIPQNLKEELILGKKWRW